MALAELAVHHPNVGMCSCFAADSLPFSLQLAAVPPCSSWQLIESGS